MATNYTHSRISGEGDALAAKAANNSNSKNLGLLGNPLGSYCSVKLNQDNYLLWKNMVLPVIRGNKMESFITGLKQCLFEFIEVTAENSNEVELVDKPEYEDWVAQDQILLGWLYNSIDVDVASELMGYETSKQLWDAIKDLFGAETRSNVVFYKREFAKLQKGSLKMADYLKAMKKLVDNLTLAGHLVSLEDLVSQVLTVV